MAVRSPTLTVMTKAAEKAGRALLRDAGEIEKLQVSSKGPADFVSNADTKSEQILKEELGRARPAYGFMAEETAQTRPDTEYTWVIDPLDGTTNFLHGIGHWAVSIALLKGAIPIAGVVFDPVRDEMFWGEKGTGAWCDATRLRVSSRQRLEQSLIATGMPFKGHDSPEFMREFQSILPKVAGIRRMGAASLDLAYVAAGRYEGFWERGLKAWDVAAGILLVQEAGGFIRPLKPAKDPLFEGSLYAVNDKLNTVLGNLLSP